jgi:hypothetical protein
MSVLMMTSSPFGQISNRVPALQRSMPQRLNIHSKGNSRSSVGLVASRGHQKLRSVFSSRLHFAREPHRNATEPKADVSTATSLILKGGYPFVRSKTWGKAKHINLHLRFNFDLLIRNL